MARLIARLCAAAAVVLGLATAAIAHQLNVFAFVEGDTVMVESKFSSGKVPISGTVRVLDTNNVLLVTLPLQADGRVAFPLDRAAAEDGLMIEVETGEGHDNYWILTPADIAKGSTGAATKGN